MSDQIKELPLTLRTLGFSEKEATVYVALLELGCGTVAEIARKAGINRTTGYDILDSLARKGVVNVSGKEPKQEYAAEPPEAVVQYLKREAEAARERIEKAKYFLPQLRSVHSSQNRPRIKFYEGTEGLKQVYEDTLTSTEPIRAYANAGEVHTGIPNYFPEYFKRRAARGISIRAIFPQTTAGIARSAFDEEEEREVAFVPASMSFSPEINIYDNKVMIASWKEKLGISIESAEIADAMKKIFELAWAEAKRLDKTLRP